MKLHGLNKLTLLDYPAHLACTVFTGTCNFRCPFCHNASLVLTPDTVPQISDSEFFHFLEGRKGKLDGVCITGGEPTLQKDLPDFIRRIRAMGFLVKLDTNGYHPDCLAHLLTEGLVDMVAMDIKNAPELYAKTCGIPEQFFQISRIDESIRLLLTSHIPFEFRTTVVKELHTEENMNAIGLWLSGLSRQHIASGTPDFPYFLQEFKTGDALVCQDAARYHAPTLDAMKQYEALLRSYLPNVSLRGM